MGLDRDFLSMLNAAMSVKRFQGDDLWGNPAYGAPEPFMAYADAAETSFGAAEEHGQSAPRKQTISEVLCDALDITVGDVVVYDGIEWTVTQESTQKDERGADLYQNLTIENQKKG